MKILITGGAGFIGSNLAFRALNEGYDVTIIDNLSREGSLLNLKWLQLKGNIKFIKSDIVDFSSLLNVFNKEKFDVVFHQAAQVAVTTSVENPRLDFNSNALGTFNVLEAIRTSGQNPVFIFASTNKVYGSLSSFKIAENNGKYILKDSINGISEQTPLDFYSPYGCSKGVADQYVLDYRRIYGLRTLVFRQSCVYGPRQMGVEDQGWVAWFVICALLGKTINIYGDGKQVRDILYIDDLLDLYFTAINNEKNLKTFAFNVGGGIKNAVSLLEVIKIIESEVGYKLKIQFSDWRPGDQLVYVSDVQSSINQFDWNLKVGPKEGISRLIKWVDYNKNIFSDVSSSLRIKS